MELMCTYCKKIFTRKRIRPAKNRFCCPECHRLWQHDNITINICKNCGKETTNPKFCCKSCSATYTNKETPKRSIEGNCINCKVPISASRIYCKSCYESYYLKDYTIITIGDLKNKRTGQQHSQVRSLARKAYIKSGRPQKCKICGYSIFFHVCHIHAIKDFNNSTSIATINDQLNLIALCPNHHTEFDAGLLSL